MSICKKYKLLLVSEYGNCLWLTLMLIRISLASLNTVSSFFCIALYSGMSAWIKALQYFHCSQLITHTKLKIGIYFCFLLNQCGKPPTFQSVKSLIMMHFKPRGDTTCLCIMNWEISERCWTVNKQHRAA